MTSRRNILLGLSGLAVGVPVFRYVRDYLEPIPEFQVLEEPSGFRKISGGLSSSGFDPFVGLDTEETRPRTISVADVKADICGALYGKVPIRSGTVPIASFSDYYCPYCRIQTKSLAELAEKLGAEVHIAWHELPLLGATSRLAARASLAAKQQDAYVAFQEHLLSSPFQATAEYLEVLAESLGVDPERLTLDMESDEVTRELDTSSALSELFAFIGTPAMVIGRTVIQGQISELTTKRIIELETAHDWKQAC